VLSIPGVSSVNRLVITVDGVEAPECRDVPLRPQALASSVTHHVSVGYAQAGTGVLP
jgi:hypothetical protein